MMDWKRRLQIQLYYVIALTCRRRVSLVVRRVFSSGLEAWKQLCRVFEPVFRRDFSGCSRPHCRQREQTVRCGKISGYQVSKRQKTPSWQCCKSYLCNEEPARQPGLQPGSLTMMCDLACDEIAEHIRAAPGVVERTDLSPRDKGEGGKKSQDGGKGVKTVKPKKCFCYVTSSRSKCEYKNL